MRQLCLRALRAPAVVAGVYITIVGVLMAVSSYHEWRGLVTAVLLFLAALIPLYLFLYRQRQQASLVALTTRFLVGEEEGRLDDLLGMLISDGALSLRIDPVSEFFVALVSACQHGQYEMKRRISEALPALFRIDLERAQGVVETLRSDLDTNGWADDNRRRTVEALMHLRESAPFFVLGHCGFVAGDQVYTAIACAEAIFSCRRSAAAGAEKAFEDLLDAMEEARKSRDEITAVRGLREVLELCDEDRRQGRARFDAMLQDANMYLRVCAVRNIRRVCRAYPQCREARVCKGDPRPILDFLQGVLSTPQHKNVRRPIAKDDSLDCLVAALRTQHRQAAKDLILRLVEDEDGIIRTTAFDKIRRILSHDAEFGRQVIATVVRRERPDSLLWRRAQHVLKDVTPEVA